MEVRLRGGAGGQIPALQDAGDAPGTTKCQSQWANPAHRRLLLLTLLTCHGNSAHDNAGAQAPEARRSRGCLPLGVCSKAMTKRSDYVHAGPITQGEISELGASAAALYRQAPLVSQLAIADLFMVLQ